MNRADGSVDDHLLVSARCREVFLFLLQLDRLRRSLSVKGEHEVLEVVQDGGVLRLVALVESMVFLDEGVNLEVFLDYLVQSFLPFYDRVHLTR